MIRYNYLGRCLGSAGGGGGLLLIVLVVVLNHGRDRLLGLGRVLVGAHLSFLAVLRHLQEELNIK